MQWPSTDRRSMTRREPFGRTPPTCLAAEAEGVRIHIAVSGTVRDQGLRFHDSLGADYAGRSVRALLLLALAAVSLGAWFTIRETSPSAPSRPTAMPSPSPADSSDGFTHWDPFLRNGMERRLAHEAANAKAGMGSDWDAWLYETMRVLHARPHRAALGPPVTLDALAVESRMAGIGVRIRSLDGWGHPYVYSTNGKQFRLHSFGADGLSGTLDDLVSDGQWDGGAVSKHSGDERSADFPLR